MVRPFAVIGFTVFVALSLIFAYEKAAIILIFVAVAAFIISMCFKSLRKNFIVPTVALSVVISVCLFMSCKNEPISAKALFDGRECTVTARITGNETKNRDRYYNIIETEKIDGADFKIKTVLRTDYSLKAQPCSKIYGKMIFKAGAGHSKSDDYYQSQKIFLFARPKDKLNVIAADKKSLNFYILNFQKSLKNNLERILPKDEGALAKALLFGDKSDLEPKLKASFADVGIAHTTAVSGLHLSIWCLFVMMLFKKFRINEKLSYAVSFFLTLFFMAITGFSHSVTRAGIMLLFVLLGKIISQRSDSLNSLGLAISVMSFINPFCVLSLGLKLSFLSTLGIILGNRAFKFLLTKDYKNTSKVRTLLNEAINYLIRIVMCTVFACVFTMPLTVIYFEKIPLFMLLTNLILNLPVALCLLFSGILAFFANIGFLSFLIPFLRRLVILNADFISDVSLSMADFKYCYLKANVRLFCIFMFAISLVMAAGSLIKVFKNNFSIKIPIAISVLLLASFCVLTFADERSKVSVMVCDVGNGSAIVLTQNRESAIIGCGGDSFMGFSQIKKEVENSGCDYIKFMLLPRNSVCESAYAKDALSEFKTDYILLGQENEELFTGENRLNYALTSVSDINLWKNTGIKCYTSYDKSYAVLTVNGKTLIINFLPSAIPDEKADILICREKIPKDVNTGSYKRVVLSADERNSIYFKLKYKDIYPTAGRGNIRIDIYKNGMITFERVR